MAGGHFHDLVEIGGGSLDEDRRVVDGDAVEWVGCTDGDHCAGRVVNHGICSVGNWTDGDCPGIQSANWEGTDSIDGHSSVHNTKSFMGQICEFAVQ